MSNNATLTETWSVKNWTFKIYLQDNHPLESYAVKAIGQHKDLIESFWLTKPAKQYETLGGCRYAILTFLQNNK